MLIDNFEADCLENLERWVSDLSEGSYLYLLIDGVFVPGIRHAFAAALRHGPISLLFETLPSCTHETQDVSPFILRYESGNESLHRVLKDCSGWPMVSALETSETQEQLFARLAAWCVVENDGQRFNLRYPDTRRLPGIFGALSLEQRGQLAGPATCWRYIGRAGSWHALEIEASGNPAKERPQKLDDSQFGKMVDDNAADEAISRLKYRGCPMPGTPSQTHAIVSRALALANAEVLESEQHLDWCGECLMRDGFGDDEAALLALAKWRADQ
ncbi:hypothetical protein ASC94_19585 [Massilia sp. Root418]|jgi:hypothetical protein|uniref:DUF4123 domain-containing protein n=1 Tax=Massilia sp. Root418 TaxID=1736532 RepID=UPI0006FFBCE0|nr:DUF4123 domain-containing protein [Massilia sp. Root418]KQW89960.1 hypothetical protein ASC94_19585 [Massilia sp. Root418]